MKIIKLPKERTYSRKKYFEGTISMPLESKSMPSVVYDKLIDYLYKAISQRLEKNQKIRTIRIDNIQFSFTTDNVNATKILKR